MGLSIISSSVEIAGYWRCQPSLNRSRVQDSGVQFERDIGNPIIDDAPCERITSQKFYTLNLNLPEKPNYVKIIYIAPTSPSPFPTHLPRRWMLYSVIVNKSQTK